MTSVNEIARWFDQGVEQGATHMIVAVDRFDHNDYPVYVMPNKSVLAEEKRINGYSMQAVMEIYNLHMDKLDQLTAETKAMNY